jgi:SAM-dependent methyltransferase
MTHNDKYEIFDRRLIRARRNRAASSFSSYDFLLHRTVEQTCERLLEINREFSTVLELGSHNGLFARMLCENQDFASLRADIQTLFQTDLSHAMISDAPGSAQGGPFYRIVCDEERLPFSEPDLDLAISHLSLHNVNDLPGTLIQIRRALKPDGLFLGAFFGGDTLHELRQSLTQAESDIEGGASPRVAPFADLANVGALLQRAGFALPVIDVDKVTVTYQDLPKLMVDLRGMGQSNSLIQRRKEPLRRATLMRASQIYQSEFADEEGRIKATFEIVFAAGWAPHGSQQQPLRPGSAKVSLSEALANPKTTLKD